MSCSCEFGALGFESHLSGIRSFEKLTGEGVSFVNTDFVQLVEEVLPQRFGGESTDYQLVEVENASGITRLKLVISPRVGAIDESAAVDDLHRRATALERWTALGAVRAADVGPDGDRHCRSRVPDGDEARKDPAVPPLQGGRRDS